ncbi:hypothetical protein F4776DRAFT_676648 [Hypoxylon sp. NC0597]|nr:hypothetical protein F4776DRAFT_676648 [Hypoxylon sp. NC0597]
MDVKRLNDAALHLHRACTIPAKSRVEYGLFGDYAITVQGKSKIEGYSTEYKGYLECLSRATKQRVINALDHREGFRLRYHVVNLQPNFCEFTWSDTQERRDEITLKVYCGPISGWREDADMMTRPCHIEGSRKSGEVNFVEPIHLLKGRIREAAMGFKHEHGADIYFLITEYDSYVRTHVRMLDLTYVGLVLQHHAYLEPVFANLDIDVDEAKRKAGVKRADKIDDEPKDIWRNLLLDRGSPVPES